MRARGLAWGALALVPALLGVAAVLTAAADGDAFEVLAFTVLSVPFALVGAIVASRQPEQRVGWLLLGVGMALAVSTVSDACVRYGLTHPSSAVRPGVAALVSSGAFAVFFLQLIVVILVLPSGRLPSRRWRVFAAGVAVLAAIDVVGVVRPGVFDDWKEEGVRNPLGIEALGSVLGAVQSVGVAMTFLLLLGAILSVPLRFRRSTGIERAQLRWIAAAVAACGVIWGSMMGGNVILGEGAAADVLWGLAILSIAFIPVGIGIAVTRYRLYEIDRVISRTLVYAVVSAVLGGSYAGLVLAGQAVFSSFAGGSNLAIAVSTLVVAALFLPVRSRVQAVVDRRFYRRRYDAQRTLEAFGARLREQVDLDALHVELSGAVDATMQPAHVGLWLRGEGP